MIVFVIHESYTAKIPHLYSGCQVFGDIFLLKVVFFFEVSAITFSEAYGGQSVFNANASLDILLF